MHEEIHQCQRYKLLLFLFCFSSMPISTSLSGLYTVLSLSAFLQVSSLYIHGNNIKMTNGLRLTHHVLLCARLHVSVLSDHHQALL